MGFGIWQHHTARICQQATIPCLCQCVRSVHGLARSSMPHYTTRHTNRAACSAAADSHGSLRIRQTDAPVIVTTKQLMHGQKDVMSLAQGVVHWGPPPAAMQAAQEALQDPSINSYGPADGYPPLVAALQHKLAHQNGLAQVDYEVMVTSGANQAFTNLVVSLLDAGDRCVLWAPYYFNHLMSLQMTGGSETVEFGPCDPSTLHPDLSWLKQRMQKPNQPRVVVLCNPCNPTGVLLSKQELQEAADICEEAGAYLVVDNTYEDFVYDLGQHHCMSAPHVIHIFSMSKVHCYTRRILGDAAGCEQAYGMMGWRVGYLAIPRGPLGLQILKAQDTIPICPAQINQRMALGALQAGSKWVAQQLPSILPSRDALIDALSPLGKPGQGVAGGEGAIYLWATLPPGHTDDVEVVRQLVQDHGVCVIPGSACGAPGHIRVAYANLEPQQCLKAAARLKAGLQSLV